jgi:hypothetical protein
MPRQEVLAKLKNHFSNPTTPEAQTAETAEQPPRTEGAGPNRPHETPPIYWSLLKERLDRVESLGVEAVTNVQAFSLQINDQLGRIEQKVTEFVDVVTDGADQDRTHYTPAEFARKAVKEGLAPHLAVRTVRRWRRKKRIKAEHRHSGRGKHGEWMIPHAEYNRYKNEGLR